MNKKCFNSKNEPMMRKGNMTYKEWAEYNEELISYMRSLPNIILEEGMEDPTIVRLQPNETIEDYMKRNNLVNGDGIIGQIKSICNSYYQSNQNDK